MSFSGCIIMNPQNSLKDNIRSCLGECILIQTPIVFVITLLRNMNDTCCQCHLIYDYRVQSFRCVWETIKLYRLSGLLNKSRILLMKFVLRLECMTCISKCCLCRLRVPIHWSRERERVAGVSYSNNLSPLLQRINQQKGADFLIGGP